MQRNFSFPSLLPTLSVIHTICNWGTAHHHFLSIACVLMPSVCTPVFRVQLKEQEKKELMLRKEIKLCASSDTLFRVQ